MEELRFIHYISDFLSSTRVPIAFALYFFKRMQIIRQKKEPIQSYSVLITAFPAGRVA
jgi:hypothetical protein